MRIVGTIDSFGNKSSYFNNVMKSNSNRFARVMNGLANPTNLLHLQVKGKNQLYKEIEETQQMDFKVLNEMALHRNEITRETEFPTNEQPEKIKLMKQQANKQDKALQMKEKQVEEIIEEHRDPDLLYQ